MSQFSNSEEEVRRALWRIIGKVLKLGHLLNENMFRIFFCTRFYNNDTQKQMIYVMHLSVFICTVFMLFIVRILLKNLNKTTNSYIPVYNYIWEFVGIAV